MTPFDCHKCLDAGVVEVIQGSFKTLALCFCKQGRKQGWQLPMIPLKDFKNEPLNWREYKSNRIGTSEFKEKIAWHLERVRTAEAYWKNEKKEFAKESE